ncbi:MAG: phosphate-starvation-inducible PsiE family protein [Desulfurococcales archaeon]|nr:phosphate-starvation-inducible PsiE family protein [Desulfurococcales archaeon]MCE4605205.1 phosphate-starvation-inducible PsiE family protein [Desulfurococcales archaeon]
MDRDSLLRSFALTLIEVLEALLATTIVVLVLISGVKLLSMVFGMIGESGVDKTEILHILDLTLLLVLSIDILRTLITAILGKYLPLRIVVEAAMIAVLREIISIEIRHLDYKMIISLTIALLGLAVLWVIASGMENRIRRMAASRP